MFSSLVPLIYSGGLFKTPPLIIGGQSAMMEKVSLPPKLQGQPGARLIPRLGNQMRKSFKGWVGLLGGGRGWCGGCQSGKLSQPKFCRVSVSDLQLDFFLRARNCQLLLLLLFFVSFFSEAFLRVFFFCSASLTRAYFPPVTGCHLFLNRRGSVI